MPRVTQQVRLEPWCAASHPALSSTAVKSWCLHTTWCSKPLEMRVGSFLGETHFSSPFSQRSDLWSPARVWLACWRRLGQVGQGTGLSLSEGTAVSLILDLMPIPASLSAHGFLYFLPIFIENMGLSYYYRTKTISLLYMSYSFLAEFLSLCISEFMCSQPPVLGVRSESGCPDVLLPGLLDTTPK